MFIVVTVGHMAGALVPAALGAAARALCSRPPSERLRSPAPKIRPSPNPPLVLTWGVRNARTQRDLLFLALMGESLIRQIKREKDPL